MNPYEVLKVSEDATEDEINRAYRKMSKDCHPDIHGEEARPLFEQLTKAKNVLMDPDRRAEYDEFGTLSQSEIDKEKENISRANGVVINIANRFAQHIIEKGYNGEDFKSFLIESLVRDRSRGNAEIEKQDLSITRMSKFIKRLKSKDGESILVIESQKNIIKTMVENSKKNRELLKSVDFAINVIVNDIDFDTTMKQYMQITTFT